MSLYQALPYCYTTAAPATTGSQYPLGTGGSYGRTNYTSIDFYSTFLIVGGMSKDYNLCSQTSNDGRPIIEKIDDSNKEFLWRKFIRLSEY